MIEVLKVLDYKQEEHKARCILGADELSELSGESVTIEGMPVGYELDFFSRCLDKTGAVAILDSTGTWNTVE